MVRAEIDELFEFICRVFGYIVFVTFHVFIHYNLVQ
jgi:hypothetical protein